MEFRKDRNGQRYAGMVVEPPLMGAIAVWTGSLRASVLTVGVLLLLGRCGLSRFVWGCPGLSRGVAGYLF